RSHHSRPYTVSTPHTHPTTLFPYTTLFRSEKAKAYNCIATLSDNYDDAYRSSPAWDEKIIARRPDGELWESRNWTGENSYIIGRSEEHTSELQSHLNLVCRLLLEKKTAKEQ